MTGMLAGEIDGVDPTDIIVLNQEVVGIGFGFQCVNVTMRVLAPSSELMILWINLYS
jgi:Holliday junction resolvasome RuvABC DNA-binding subunit